MSGLSKSVATGLRVGFLAAPVPVVSAIERAIRATTWNTPAVTTAIACRWLEDGTVNRIAAALAREHISVATAEPFAASAPVPQAIRLALGSADLDNLRTTLSKVRQVVEADAYS